MLESIFIEKVIKQQGPTCGPYALINALLHLSNKSNLKTSNQKDFHHFIVQDLIQKNLIQGRGERGKTFLGEFFTNKDFQVFIENNSDAIVRFLWKEYSQIQLKVSECPIEEIINPITNGFYMVLMLPTRFLPIAHWIAVFPEDGMTFKAINPLKGCILFKKYDEIQKKNNALRGRSFSWLQWKHISRFERRCFQKNHPESRYLDIFDPQMKEFKNYIKNGILPKKINYPDAGKCLKIQAIRD